MLSLGHQVSGTYTCPIKKRTHTHHQKRTFKIENGAADVWSMNVQTSCNGLDGEHWALGTCVGTPPVFEISLRHLTSKFIEIMSLRIAVISIFSFSGHIHMSRPENCPYTRARACVLPAGRVSECVPATTMLLATSIKLTCTHWWDSVLALCKTENLFSGICMETVFVSTQHIYFDHDFKCKINQFSTFICGNGKRRREKK